MINQLKLIKYSIINYVKYKINRKKKKIEIFIILIK